jgi:hypothetical protein
MGAALFGCREIARREAVGLISDASVNPRRPEHSWSRFRHLREDEISVIKV